MTTLTPDIARRRHAASQLGDALRDFLDAVCANEADPDVLADLAESTRAMTDRLAGSERPVLTMSTADERGIGLTMYAPVRGAANPIAPPLTLVRDSATTMSARATLGRRYEGPPGCVHGGISALLLDEMLGACAIACGAGGMTVKLDLTYRAPVPIGVPIIVRARLVSVDGRKTAVVGSITAVDAPEHPLVEAEGLWVAPRPEVAQRLFGALVRADGAPLPQRAGWADRA